VDTRRICLQCREPLPENVSEGLCPACAAKVALGSKPASDIMAKALFYTVAGAVTFLFLQWHFSRSWRSYYVHFSWPGYGHAMQDGNVPPSMAGSPRSLLIGEITLCLLPIVTLWFAGSRLKNALSATLALWAGVMICAVILWIATPQLRKDSNMWPIDLVFLAFQTGVPLWAGCLVVLTVRSLAVYAVKNLTRSKP
jgi:hypothetical protein